MSLFKSFCTAAVLSLALPATAMAATSLATISYDYGSAKDKPTGWAGDPPSQRDPLNTDNVRMHDTSTASGYNQFIQIFDLSIPELDGMTITSFEITLQYSQVDSAAVDNGVAGDPSDDTGELWYARVLGGPTPDNSLDDDFFKVIPGIDDGEGTDTGTFSFVLDEANDGNDSESDRTDAVSTPNTAFQSSIDNGFLRLRFREESGGDDIMWLDSAQLEVFGTPAPIPVPASGLLLIGAVSGMLALRRRNAAT